MANELRIRANFQAGTITDNPLTNVATTINSAAFANLPAVTSTSHIALVLDPLGSAGAPEIVWVTAHTAAATSATVLRAQEGTAARQHASGIPWRLAPTALDFSRVWDPPACELKASAAQSIPNATETVVLFDTEVADTDNMHSTVSNTGRITINTIGRYLVTGTLPYVTGTGGNRRYEAFIRLNATGEYLALANAVNATAAGTYLSLSCSHKFAVGDFVELRANIDNGGALNTFVSAPTISPRLAAVWQGQN